MNLIFSVPFLPYAEAYHRRRGVGSASKTVTLAEIV